MLRFAIGLVLLTSFIAVAGGVVRLVRVDPAGEMRFAPTVDRAALSWYLDRAKAWADEGDDAVRTHRNVASAARRRTG